LTGDPISVSVSETATGASLIAAIEGAKPELRQRIQRLIFGGKAVDSGATLASYNIRSGSVVHCIIREGAASPLAGSSSSHTLSAGSAAPNHVIEVEGGEEEFSSLLTRHSTSLIVVDWNAPWCGPCRAIRPALDGLARDPRLVILSINTEATPANGSFCIASGIRAFPTFHFYKNKTKVAETAGANLAQIQSTIERLTGPTALSGAAVAASSSSSSSSGGSGMMGGAPSWSNALSLVTSSNPTDVALVLCRTLLKMIQNIARNPEVATYRTVHKSNKAFATKVGNVRGGEDCMRAAGFISRQEGMKDIWTMPAAPASQLQAAERALQGAITELTEDDIYAEPAPLPSTGASAGAATNPFASMMGAMGGGGNMGGMPNMGNMGDMLGGNGGMPDPALMMQLMADPELMALMQRSAGNPMAAMQEMQSNPQLMMRMMQNPAVQNLIQQRMRSGGMPGMPPAGSAQPSSAPPPAFNFPSPGAAVPPQTQAPPQTPQAVQPPAQPPHNDLILQGMTEEEMLEEAIRQSLQDSSNDSGHHSQE
jgi:thiol-disulfide isomerase/thioredoxin